MSFTTEYGPSQALKNVVQTLAQSELIQIDPQKDVVFETPPPDVVSSITHYFEAAVSRGSNAESPPLSDSDSLFLTQSVVPVVRTVKRHQPSERPALPISEESEDERERDHTQINEREGDPTQINAPHQEEFQRTLPRGDADSENTDDDLLSKTRTALAQSRWRVRRPAPSRPTRTKFPFLQKFRLGRLSIQKNHILVNSVIGGFFKCIKKINKEHGGRRRELGSYIHPFVFEEDEMEEDDEDNQDDIKKVDAECFVLNANRRNRSTWLPKKRCKIKLTSTRTGEKKGKKVTKKKQKCTKSTTRSLRSPLGSSNVRSILMAQEEDGERQPEALVTRSLSSSIRTGEKKRKKVSKKKQKHRKSATRSSLSPLGSPNVRSILMAQEEDSERQPDISETCSLSSSTRTGEKKRKKVTKKKQKHRKSATRSSLSSLGSPNVKSILMAQEEDSERRPDILVTCSLSQSMDWHCGDHPGQQVAQRRENLEVAGPESETVVAETQDLGEESADGHVSKMLEDRSRDGYRGEDGLCLVNICTDLQETAKDTSEDNHESQETEELDLESERWIWSQDLFAQEENQADKVMVSSPLKGFRHVESNEDLGSHVVQNDDTCLLGKNKEKPSSISLDIVDRSLVDNADLLRSSQSHVPNLGKITSPRAEEIKQKKKEKHKKTTKGSLALKFPEENVQFHHTPLSDISPTVHPALDDTPSGSKVNTDSGLCQSIVADIQGDNVETMKTAESQMFNYGGLSFLKRKRKRTEVVEVSSSSTLLQLNTDLNKSFTSQAHNSGQEVVRKKRKNPVDKGNEGEMDINSAALMEAAGALQNNTVQDSEVHTAKVSELKAKKKRKRDESIHSLLQESEGPCLEESVQMPYQAPEHVVSDRPKQLRVTDLSSPSRNDVDSEYSSPKVHKEINEDVVDVEQQRKMKKKVKKRSEMSDVVSLQCDEESETGHHSGTNTCKRMKRGSYLEFNSVERQDGEITVIKMQSKNRPESLINSEVPAFIEHPANCAFLKTNVTPRKKKKKKKKQVVVVNVDPGQVEATEQFEITGEIQDSEQHVTKAVADTNVKKKKKKHRSTCLDTEVTHEEEPMETPCRSENVTPPSCGMETNVSQKGSGSSIHVEDDYGPDYFDRSTPLKKKKKKKAMENGFSLASDVTVIKMQSKNHRESLINSEVPTFIEHPANCAFLKTNVTPRKKKKNQVVVVNVDPGQVEATEQFDITGEIQDSEQHVTKVVADTKVKKKKHRSTCLDTEVTHEEEPMETPCRSENMTPPSCGMETNVSQKGSGSGIHVVDDYGPDYFAGSTPLKKKKKKRKAMENGFSLASDVMDSALDYISSKVGKRPAALCNDAEGSQSVSQTELLHEPVREMKKKKKNKRLSGADGNVDGGVSAKLIGCQRSLRDSQSTASETTPQKKRNGRWDDTDTGLDTRLGLAKKLKTVENSIEVSVTQTEKEQQKEGCVASTGGELLQNIEKKKKKKKKKKQVVVVNVDPGQDEATEQFEITGEIQDSEQHVSKAVADTKVKKKKKKHRSTCLDTEVTHEEEPMETPCRSENVTPPSCGMETNVTQKGSGSRIHVEDDYGPGYFVGSTPLKKKKKKAMENGFSLASDVTVIKMQSKNHPESLINSEVQDFIEHPGNCAFLKTNVTPRKKRKKKQVVVGNVEATEQFEITGEIQDSEQHVTKAVADTKVKKKKKKHRSTCLDTKVTHEEEPMETPCRSENVTPPSCGMETNVSQKGSGSGIHVEDDYGPDYFAGSTPLKKKKKKRKAMENGFSLASDVMDSALDYISSKVGKRPAALCNDAEGSQSVSQTELLHEPVREMKKKKKNKRLSGADGNVDGGVSAKLIGCQRSLRDSQSTASETTPQKKRNGRWDDTDTGLDTRPGLAKKLKTVENSIEVSVTQTEKEQQKEGCVASTGGELLQNIEKKKKKKKKKKQVVVVNVDPGQDEATEQFEITGEIQDSEQHVSKAVADTKVKKKKHRSTFKDSC